MQQELGQPRGTTNDYIPYHSFFNYSASTANLNHTRPASVAEVGHNGPANHNYDLDDLIRAVKAGNFPAVNFIKAAAYQDGHAGYADPLDEQVFLVNLINFLQEQPSWKDTAVIIMYDDSDGSYDHQLGPIVNPSSGTADALTGPGCAAIPRPRFPAWIRPMRRLWDAAAMARCQPFLVISPWAKENFVDSTVTDQTSVLRFIEENWLGGQQIGQGGFDQIAGSIYNVFDFSAIRSDGTLILSPETGEPIP